MYGFPDIDNINNCAPTYFDNLVLQWSLIWVYTIVQYCMLGVALDLTVTNLIKRVEDLKLFHYELVETLGTSLAQLIVLTKLVHKGYRDLTTI